MEKLKRLPVRAQNAVFDRLERVVDIAALTKEERIKYDESIKVYIRLVGRGGGRGGQRKMQGIGFGW